jgi:hypothetical protein
MFGATARHRALRKMNATEKGCGFPQPCFLTLLLLSCAPADQNL